MSLRKFLGMATVLATGLAIYSPASFAQSSPISGAYVNLGLGGNYLPDQRIQGTRGSGLQGHVETSYGFIGSLAAGYGLGNGIRVELQGDFRDNKLGRAGLLHAGGQEQQYGGFINTLYDFNSVSLFGTNLVPYVGFGLGYEQVVFNNGHAYGPVNGVPTYIRTTSTDGNFAVQGMVGAAYNFESYPGLALTAEYRATAIPGQLDFKSQIYQPGQVGRANFKTEGQYNHSALIGIRYAFNAAPPAVETSAPSPVPVSATPSRTYLVFFDWDRADLSTRARQVIAEAASATTRVQVTRIEVSGYTDTSGSPKYNQNLSVQRAHNVSNELVRDGVPANAISVHGYGETNLLVKTADGVREPQNRRVEIILK